VDESYNSASQTCKENNSTMARMEDRNKPSGLRLQQQALVCEAQQNAEQCVERSVGTCNHASGLLSLNVLQRRQAEGQGLAGAGGGDAHKVPARLDDGPALRLYRRRLQEGARHAQQLLSEA
jgi:hypothetical protein